MDNITKMTETALTRYFNSLHVMGYMSQGDVNKLVLLSVLEEMLTSELSYFINEQDYRTITNALYCILGNNCMIDFPSYATWDSLIHKATVDVTRRITEDNTLRYTEDSNYRIEA